MKKYSYRTPERPVGEIFTYNRGMYIVADTEGLPLCGKIGCTTKDPVTGNIKNLCAFADHCGMVNARHRGFCTRDMRKDGRTVYFIKLR